MFERANSIFGLQPDFRQIGGNAMSQAALPNQSLHSDATALCHLLHRALWISVLHPKSTLAVPPVSSNVRLPMRLLVVPAIMAMASPGLAGDPEFAVDAVLSVATLREVVKLVKKIDREPILSIYQEKVARDESVPTPIDELIKDRRDPNKLIVNTGVVRGPLNGGGFVHHLERVNGKWRIVKSIGWVS